MADKSELLAISEFANLPEDQIEWFLSHSEEMHLQAGETYIQQGAPADAPPKDVVIRQIKGLDLSTTLSLIRSHGEQRPSAALVWEMAKKPPTKRKPERRRLQSERKRSSCELSIGCPSGPDRGS